jgi:hypothetical protein
MINVFSTCIDLIKLGKLKKKIKAIFESLPTDLLTDFIPARRVSTLSNGVEHIISFYSKIFSAIFEIRPEVDSLQKRNGI